MPEPKKYLEKICAYCRFYEIIIGTGPGNYSGPYCHEWKMPFPEPYEWAINPEKSKPGERTCKKWKKRAIR
jgi:hypothetical protein